LTTDDIQIERAVRACHALAPADLYTVLRTGLGERRGWHVYQVHGGGAIGCHPRTTCGDVVRLTALWRSYLADHDQAALARWQDAAIEAEQICAGLDEASEYPKNRAYWRALRYLAVTCQGARARNDSTDPMNNWRAVEVTDEAGKLRVSAENVAAIDIQNALYFHFGERRGWETSTMQLKQKDGSLRTEERRHPKTTCADVVELAAFWTREVARAPHNYDDMVPGAQRQTWSAAAAKVAKHCEGTPDRVYPENPAFWKAMRAAAISIDVERDNVQRSKFDAVVGTFKAIGAGLSSAAVGAARTVGTGAGSLLGGFLDAVGVKTLLIGTGVVVGAIVIVPQLLKEDHSGA